ncbi:MAG: hypothetical protein IPP02_12265 [Chitinophagaceae bacterium]|nr:hypothetical protein [Chitinophagaceae bacterium]
MKKLLICLSFFISVSAFSQNNTFSLAPLISTTSTCVNGTNQFSHTLSGATNEAATISGIGCGTNNARSDVWYRFTTQTEFPIVTVTPTGTSWTTTEQIKIQILSGTALTALTERGCGSSSWKSSSYYNRYPVATVPQQL